MLRIHYSNENYYDVTTSGCVKVVDGDPANHVELKDSVGDTVDIIDCGINDGVVAIEGDSDYFTINETTMMASDGNLEFEFHNVRGVIAAIIALLLILGAC